MGDRDNLPELPTNWIWTTLGEIVEVIRGASPRPKGDPRFFGGSIPWIMISDISKEKGKYISTTRDTVTESGAKLSRYLKVGTLILSNSGTVCVPKILAVNGCIHDGFVAFPNLTEDLEILYLYYFFEKIRQKIIQENRQGITQVNLNTDIVRNITIPLPPLAEQHRIVAKIEELFSELDAGVELLKKLKAKLKRYRQSVLKAAVEGKLTKDWREAHQGELEPASVLLERILKERHQKWEAQQLAQMKAKGKTPKDDSWKLKYKEPVAPDTSDLPELPEGWVWTNIEIIGEVSGGLTKNSKRDKFPLKMPYLRVANVYADSLQLDDVKQIGINQAEIDRVLLEKGDLLVVEGNGSIDQIGRVALWDGSISPCLHQNHLIKVRFKPIEIAKYILLWLLSVDGRKQITRVASSTSGLHTLSLSKVAVLPVPLPPLTEQPKIVEAVERFLSVIDELEKVINQNIKRAEKLRQSILNKAFEGKLVSQDLTDEPADKLLERIKAEKAKREAEAKAKKKRKQPKKSQQLELF
jgi:type I restriction enzyme S subunit